MEQEEHRHPAYGQLSFNRVTCTPGEHFYGSELRQDHYIKMELRTSELKRELSKDWYFANKLICQLRMSAGQFSELITSLNQGGGTPVTIEFLNGKVDNLPDIENRKEFVHRKFQDRMKEFAAKLRGKQNRVKELTAKKTLSKADQQELNQTVEWLTQEVASNIPFFARCFQETMDEVVSEAKKEVENAIQHKINVLGFAELHKQNKLIEP